MSEHFIKVLRFMDILFIRTDVSELERFHDPEEGTAYSFNSKERNPPQSRALVAANRSRT